MTPAQRPKRKCCDCGMSFYGKLPRYHSLRVGTVFQTEETGSWYYWDTLRSYRIGPFPSEHEARAIRRLVKAQPLDSRACRRIREQLALQLVAEA